jgi:hypothetical protein
MAKKLLQDVFPIHAHIDTWVSIESYLNGLRVIGSTDMHLQQYVRAKTDIQSEDGCAICNVPTDFKKNSVIIPAWDLALARMSEVAVVLFVAYHVYKRM